MRRIHVFPRTALIALVLLFAACACDRRAEGEQGERSPQAAVEPDQSAELPSAPAATAPVQPVPVEPVPVQPAGPRLNPGDESFLAQTSRVNEDEIATTDVGMARGSESLQELSRMLNGDHIALRDRITELAPNIAPSPGAAPPGLETLEDGALDARLLEVYREQHEQAIRVFLDASTDQTLSEPVRSLAAETLPSLRKHMDAVKAASASE
jgi:hypothetical protein